VSPNAEECDARADMDALPITELLVSPVRVQREFSIGLDVADGEGIDAGVAGLLTPKNVTEYVPELVNFFDSIVVEKRGTDDAAVKADSKALHQSRSIHVAIANADSTVRHSLGDKRRRNVRKVGAKCGNALSEAGGVVDAIHSGRGGL